MSSSGGMGWWLDQIGRIPLLTPSQEIELGTAVQAWLNHSAGPDECPPGIRRRGQRAKDRFVSANLRLAVSYISKRCNRLAKAHSVDDLVQAANIGLIRAVEKYDPTKGYRFSTYAYWWIRQSVNHWVDTQSRIIAIPGSHSQHLTKLAGIRRRLSKELNRDPTRLELAEELGVSLKVFDQLLINARSIGSLDATIADDGLTLAELIPAEAATVEEQEEAQDQEHRSQQLHKSISKLPKLHQRVLRGAWGIDCLPMGMRQLAKAEGMSVPEIQAVLQSAQDQLKAAVVQLTLFTVEVVVVHRQQGVRRRRVKADSGQLVLFRFPPSDPLPSAGGLRKRGRPKAPSALTPAPPRGAAHALRRDQ
jgi:RNA polymerase primary sigma factor